MKKLVIRLIGAFVIMGLVACGGGKQEQKGEHNDHEHTEAHEGHEHSSHEGHNHDHEEHEHTAGINSSQLENLLNAYFELKDALVATDEEKAHDIAMKLAKGAEDKEGSAQDVANVARLIGSTPEVEKQREHFEELSKVVYRIVKSDVPLSHTVYKQYCPMAFNNKGAYWLSNKEEIRNPYFGDKMLKCGKVQETIEAK